MLDIKSERKYPDFPYGYVFRIDDMGRARPIYRVDITLQQDIGIDHWRLMYIGYST